MLFDELRKYNNTGHFFFKAENDLGQICNAPKDKSGVYLVYALKSGDKELIYIGSSGQVQNDGTIKHRKGGLWGRIVKGQQFGKVQRKISWPSKMREENIEALDIYWYDTFNSETKDIPVYTEALLMQRFFEMNKRLPRWNKEL